SLIMHQREADGALLQLRQCEHVPAVANERERSLSNGRLLRVNGRRWSVVGKDSDMGRHLRKVSGRQKRTVRQSDGAADGMLELPEVARPAVAGEQSQRLRGQAPDGLALVRSEAPGEETGPFGDGV